MARSAGQRGSGAVGGVALLALILVVGFVSLRFYKPYKEYLQTAQALKAAVQQCVTLTANDERCLGGFDQDMKGYGLTFPSSKDLMWTRIDEKTVEVGFSYTEDVDLLVWKREMKFKFHCRATPAGCSNDAS